MEYTTQEVVEALKVFNARNESDDTKFEPYLILDWHIKQLELLKKEKDGISNTLPA